MKKSLPGIILLLTTPCSILAFVKVEALTGSEILGLLSAVFLYVGVAGILALLFNKKISHRTKNTEQK